MNKLVLLFLFSVFSIAIQAQSPEHASWDTILKTHVNNDGDVNYKAINANQEPLSNYLEFLSQNPPKDSWSKNEKLSYWINAYNAFTIKLIIDNYPIKSIKDIKQPWDKKFFKIGDAAMSLNDIEHEILRKMNEPRIHFAIVCASYSCPKLQNEAFTAENLEDQLVDATKVFLADKNRNEISENSIKISKIFDWFSKDFKQNGSLIDFLNQYTEITISSNAKKRFKDYNWALNE
jgi:hypothetical protein